MEEIEVTITNISFTPMTSKATHNTYGPKQEDRIVKTAPS